LLKLIETRWRFVFKMSQDIVADALNRMINAKRAGHNSLTIYKHSKLLLSILALAKLKGYVKSYKVKDNILEMELDNLHACKAIKPRYTITVKDIDKYVRRYLPARNLGILIISTNQGLMTNQTAEEKQLGGSAIAYMY
jgi:small subunit ribosomal protein S8